MDEIATELELEALDRALDGRDADQPPDPVAELVRTAQRLRAALTADVPADLTERHVAEAVAAFADVPPADVVPLPRRARAKRTVVASVLAAAMLAGGGTGAMAAASHSLPGEVLYPLKRAGEALSLAIHRDPRERARLHLEFAQRRLVELEELLAAGHDPSSVDVGAAMSAYAGRLREAERELAATQSNGQGPNLEALLAQLEGQLSKQVTRLTYLRDNKVPEQARAAIQRAIDNAEKAKERVANSRGKSRGHGKPDGKPKKASSEAPGRENAGRSRR